MVEVAVPTLSEVLTSPSEKYRSEALSAWLSPDPIFQYPATLARKMSLTSLRSHGV